MYVSPPIAPHRAVVREAVGSSVIPFTGASREKDDHKWQSINDNISGRELPSFLQQRAVANSFKAWRENPMGKRLIEMIVNFVLGNGVTCNSQDDSVLNEMILWWTDEYNEWPDRLTQRLRDLYIYGEWLHRPLVDKQGFVRIADLQPDIIVAAVPDQYDMGICDAVVIKEAARDGHTYQKNVSMATIRKRLEPVTFALDKLYTGDLFYFGINRTTDSLRGVGELFSLLDYIDLYDDMLYSRAEKVRLMSQIWWDVSIDGWTPEQVRKWLEEQTDLPPRPGSVWAHNSQISLSVVTPDLKADDHVQDAQLMKSNIVANAGWPGTFWDDSGAGRASAQEMAEPALRNVINFQGTVARFIAKEFRYHLERRGLDSRAKFTITFNRPSARDIQKIGPALRALSEFITKMVGVYAMTQAEAREIVASQVTQLGISDVPIAMDLPPELKEAAEAARKLKEEMALVKQQPPGQKPQTAKEALDLVEALGGERPAGRIIVLPT